MDSASQSEIMKPKNCTGQLCQKHRQTAFLQFRVGHTGRQKGVPTARKEVLELLLSKGQYFFKEKISFLGPIEFQESIHSGFVQFFKYFHQKMNIFRETIQINIKKDLQTQERFFIIKSKMHRFRQVSRVVI